MYEIYQRLLDKKGLKNADVARATGISNMTLSDWKRGKTTPKADKIEKIAGFLDVTVDYLVRGEEANAIADTANKDYALSRMPDKIKEYALKLSKLDQDKQNQIMSLIDMLDNKN